MSAIGSGRCGLCGDVGTYVVTELPTRENHECATCRATLRYRVQAAAIVAAYGRHGDALVQLVRDGTLRDLVIYEPGIGGPLRGILRNIAGYFNSYYWPDVASGDERDGIRCEDLQRLTLGDASVDLIVSSDIFEHVRDPMLGFAETFRVLRPGGHHIFTVPLFWPLPGTSKSRVDTSGPEDVYILPPEYHNSPTDPQGSLVYNEFGMDLPDQLCQLGFETTTYHGYRNAIAFVARKPR